MKQVAYAVIIAGFLIGAGLLLRLSLRRTSPAGPVRDKVPPALRPGDPDDVLESDRLLKVQRWGAVTSVLFAAFVAVYWLAEPGRMQAKTKRFEEISVERGNAYFHAGTKIVEGAQVEGVECSRCHGEGAVGGENEFIDPVSGISRLVKVPELATVFARYEKPPPGFLSTRAFVYETIERGRPGTDMPTWGNKFGGPLTEQQITDVVNYLMSIQKEIKITGANGQQIFAQFCSSCHGQSGTGGSGPAMVGGSEARQFPTIEDHLAFVKAGSKRDAPYGTSGRGTGAMPAWEGVLTAEQIRAVVEYERSL